MFEKNKDFYPTPEHIIDKMLFGLDVLFLDSVLEPSAGSGNIVDALKKKEKSYRERKPIDIDCIEQDDNLQKILKGKGYRLVYNDFLSYETMKEYDLIIMNPPFSDGCKHLLKALELQERNGGSVVCLLNAETIKNAYTNDRKYLIQKLTEYDAKIEFIQNAFIDAERKTGVEIALIKVKLPEVRRTSFILEGLKKSKKEAEPEQSDCYFLSDADFFKSIVNQYQMEVESGIKLIKEYYALKPFILSSFGKDKDTGETIQTGGCILSLDISTNRSRYNNILSVNEYIREVRRKYWSALFENQKFVGQLTGNLQREFYNKVDELRNYDFSLFNIYQLKIEMQKSVIKGIEETILALFDELSHKHHWYDETSNNIHYYNGWKTNKAWIINKKVIIPLSGFRDLDYSWGGFRPSHSDVIRKLQDIEKCFNYLDGGLTDAVDLEESLKFAEEYEETKNIQLKYFTVSFFKKGTCHIVFNNDELLKKFNIFGSMRKGWLPPSYGKKKYKDMMQEEKSVVNEFEGEAEYNKTLSNLNYYIFDSNNIQLIEQNK